MMVGRQKLPAEVCRDSRKAFMGSCLGVFEMCGSDIVAGMHSDSFQSYCSLYMAIKEPLSRKTFPICSS